MILINYNKVYFYIVLIFSFILPLSRAGIVFCLSLLLVIWIFEGDFKRKYYQVKNNKILVSIFLFLLASSIFLFFSEDFEQGLNTLRLASYMLGVFIIATSLSPKYIQVVITSFLLGMLVSEVISYGVFFEIWEFKYATPSNPSPFMIHIEYSVFLAFTSLILLNRIVSNRYSKKEKVFLLIFFLSVTGNLFITAGRTGQVALIAGTLVLFIIHYKLTFKSLILSLLVLVSIYFSAYNTSDTFNKRVNQAKSDISKVLKDNYYSSWGLRVAYWIVTYDILKEKPLGSGLGDYKNAIKNNLEQNKRKFSKKVISFMSSHHPHNQFLLVLLQMGIIGIVLLINIIYSVLSCENESRELKELSIIFVTVYFVSSMAEPLLIKQFSLSLFVFFIGLFAINHKNNKY